ncbi:ABC transporter permease [Clostridium oceanicum]|uniref:ABC transporter permease n=1 Tax=Clostridium oceanicum TaxID=1543 RepID=A0ABP3UTL4_9CLOT
MNLVKLIIRNLKKNIYNYYLYFIAIFTNVMLYNVFQSIRFNKQLNDFLYVQDSVLGNKSIFFVFYFASIIITLFSLIFIWNSTNFFIRKRKKEIGTYLLLGVRRRQIGSMIFIENIIIGIVALLIGTFMGTMLSKLFIMVLLRSINVYMIVNFTVSIEAITHTFYTFGILFLIISIHGYRYTYKFKLIEFFRPNETKVFIENLKKIKTIIFAILSIIFICISYILVLKISKPKDVLLVPLALIIGIIGTFMFFSSFLVLSIKFLRKIKRFYYKNTNSIAISNISNRINEDKTTLSIICLLTSITIILVGLTITSNKMMKGFSKNRTTSFSYVYESNDKNLDKAVEKIIFNNHTNTIKKSCEAEFLRYKTKIDESKISMEKSDQGKYTIDIISQSQFNKVAKSEGYKNIVEVKNDKNAIEAFQDGRKFSGSYDLDIFEKSENLKVNGETDYDIFPGKFAGLTYIVTDKTYNELYNKDNIRRLKGYFLTNIEDSYRVTEDIRKIMPADSKFYALYDEYKIMNISFGSFIFTAIFIAIVFIISTASIIYFRTLSESFEERQKYIILKNIGASKVQIKSCVKKQIRIIFGLPLVVTLFHSIVGLIAFSKILEIDFTVLASIMLVSYLLVYYIYYIITVKSYIKIINTNN